MHAYVRTYIQQNVYMIKIQHMYMYKYIHTHVPSIHVQKITIEQDAWLLMAVPMSLSIHMATFTDIEAILNKKKRTNIYRYHPM